MGRKKGKRSSSLVFSHPIMTPRTFLFSREDDWGQVKVNANPLRSRVSFNKGKLAKVSPTLRKATSFGLWGRNQFSLSFLGTDRLDKYHKPKIYNNFDKRTQNDYNREISQRRIFIPCHGN